VVPGLKEVCPVMHHCTVLPLLLLLLLCGRMHLVQPLHHVRVCSVLSTECLKNTVEKHRRT